MKRIAFFQDDLTVGGIQKSLINLLNNLDYFKYSVDLYLFRNDGIWRNRIPDTVRVRYLQPVKNFYKYLPFDYALTNTVYDFSDVEENYDLAIDFNSYQPGTAIAAITVPAEKRAMWVHNDVEIKYHEEWKYRVLFNAMKGKYKYFEEFACVSGAIVDPFKRMTGENEKDYFVIPNYVDVAEIFNGAYEDVYDTVFDENCYNICAVGRLCHQKGYDLMLDDFSKAVKQRENLRLVIIGDGPEYKMITDEIQSLGLNDKVRVLGRKQNPYAYMNRCDALISTSRYEGQGINIMEAEALGLKILIPTRLERYVEGASGTDDIVSTLVHAEKTEKKFNNLAEYNQKTLAMIDKLC